MQHTVHLPIIFHPLHGLKHGLQPCKITLVRLNRYNTKIGNSVGQFCKRRRTSITIGIDKNLPIVLTTEHGIVDEISDSHGVFRRSLLAVGGSWGCLVWYDICSEI